MKSCGIGSALLVLVWVLIGFLAVVISTGDLRYMWNRMRDQGGFYVTREDFKLFYIPAWARMALLAVSAGISCVFLSSVGIDF
jgi:hypothetical protein